jgi:zinc transport system substrate-binding protein
LQILGKRLETSSMRKFTLVLCTLSLFLAFGCQKRNTTSSKPIVLVSAPPYLDFVQRIAGETVTALSLVPVGANPHIYEPTPKEMEHLREAALWLRLGEPSDQKAYSILKESPMHIADITEGLALLPLAHSGCSHAHHEHESHDLHVWLSPKLAAQQAKIISAHLCALLPENKERYEEALLNLLSDLQCAHEEISKLLASKSGSALLVSHPAFTYFCNDYNLEQLSIEVEGKEPLPQDIHSLFCRIKERTIHSILTQPQYSDKAAKLMAEHLQLPIYEIDPYAQDYFKNLNLLAERIAE